MSIDRRLFLQRVATLSGGAFVAPSLRGLTTWSDAAAATALRGRDNGGFGQLVQSVDCPELWIPEGFRVTRLSESLHASHADETFIVPNAMDGMAAFALPNGNVRLIRNHEMTNPPNRAAPLGTKPYDALASGGTTSLEVHIGGSGADREATVVAEFVSLGGTHVNCAGGPTPWGSWLSCEETTSGTAHGFGQPHGYIFEVPVAATGAVDPVPLRAMGRFVHEAVAVDPRNGIVYETEDVRWAAHDEENLPGSGFYRFLPRTPGRLVDGGRLQILAVRGQPAYSTILGQQVGTKIPVGWLDIDDPDPGAADHDPSAIFRAARQRGAALFQRLEGCFWGDDSCYFVSTSGGDARAGQVWRFIPHGDDDGWLTLVFESPSRQVLDSPDNICLTRRGGVIICEDGAAEQYIRGLRTDGTMIDIVMQPDVAGEPDPTEFAGCCFDPEGDVLFFNVQGSLRSYQTRSGSTYALWGPWDRAQI
jgi:uncharacterized protein